MIRRTFIRNSFLSSSSMLLLPGISFASELGASTTKDEEIRTLATSLLEQWCKGLYANQTVSPGDFKRDGGIFSPGDDVYLGRCADAIYPFLWMAKHTNDDKYIVAAKKVYDWEQRNCWSEEDGCWINDPYQKDGWKAISVFSVITKMEAIEHYSDLLGTDTVYEWKDRLRIVADYIYRTFHIDYTNINYPATATLALYKLGKLFNQEKYLAKAEEIAHGLLDYFTSEGLFFGEGGREMNEYGQYPIDLGYNVEESLPAMASYCRLSGNRALYDKVLHSMKVHLEFMLPNGGWDNSWGTRSFKWTMWGSRTSDGCQPGYYLLSDDVPVFAEAVLRNLQCLENSTHNNILHSGPHEAIAGVTPSIHHTFDHAKALTILLNTGPRKSGQTQDVLPREEEYGIKKFENTNTILFSTGPWRGTITSYNILYRNKGNGHPSGGALSCLYHTQLGILSASSMTEYMRWEAHNMLDENTLEHFMCLTPRLELRVEGEPVYRNISDLQSALKYEETEGELKIMTRSRLVTGEQEIPQAGAIGVSMDYFITKNALSIEIGVDKKPREGQLNFVFPLVSTVSDQIQLKENGLSLKNAKGELAVELNFPLQNKFRTEKRVYNFNPGLQAYPIEIDCDAIHMKKLILEMKS